VTNPARRQRIFISYRRADSAGHAGRLKDELTRRLGDRVFMDVSDIAAGVDFEHALRAELASCGAVLAVVGPRWRAAFDAPRDGTDYVRAELAQALGAAGLPVVPVLVQGAGPGSLDGLPPELQALAKRQAVVLRDDRWHDDVAQLARELRAALRLPRMPTWALGAGVVALAVAGYGLYVATRPAPDRPAPYARERARQAVVDATVQAAAACRPPAGPVRECPLVFEFVPSGAVRQVWFASGSCALKAPPFGDCLLERLAGVRIPPFDDLPAAEVGLNVVVGADGSTQVQVEP
jgi:hypothetical protein